MADRKKASPIMAINVLSVEPITYPNKRKPGEFGVMYKAHCWAADDEKNVRVGTFLLADHLKDIKPGLYTPVVSIFLNFDGRFEPRIVDLRSAPVPRAA